MLRPPWRRDARDHVVIGGPLHGQFVACEGPHLRVPIPSGANSTRQPLDDGSPLPSPDSASSGQFVYESVVLRPMGMRYLYMVPRGTRARLSAAAMRAMGTEEGVERLREAHLDPRSLDDFLRDAMTAALVKLESSKSEA